MEDYNKLTNIIINDDNNRILYNFLIQNPKYDYKVIVELALLHRKLDLVTMVLNYNGQNNPEFWNELLVNAAATGEMNVATYLIDQGANNLAEAFYCAKNYNNEEVAEYLVTIVAQQQKYNKENININSLFENKQHDLIYEYFRRTI